MSCSTTAATTTTTASVSSEKTKSSNPNPAADYVNSLCPPKTKEDALKHTFRFWNTQPVPKFTDKITTDGPVRELEAEADTNTGVETPLPAEFEWAELSGEEQFTELSKFLNRFCHENLKSRVRTQYSVPYLQYQLTDPDLCFGVRVKKNGLLVGFIGGRYTKTRVNRTDLNTVQTVLVCVNPKLRGKRLTVVLAQELTRRAKLKGVVQGVYSTQRYVPRPFCSTQLFNRPLNSNKLITAGFLKTTGNVELDDLNRTFKLPKRPANAGFVKMEDKHLEQAYQRFTDYIGRYKVHPIYTREQFIDRFSNQKDLVTTYVLIEEEEDRVVDMISYLIMKSNVIKTTNSGVPIAATLINTGYITYYTANEETAYRLVSDIMIVARDSGIDVMYCLDSMENNCLLKELKFEEGVKTNLQYYLYNWKTATCDPSHVGLTLY